MDPKLMVDMVEREWHQILREDLDVEGEALYGMMNSVFTIFYVTTCVCSAIFYIGVTYLVARDPVFLQQAIDCPIATFERVGLDPKTKKPLVMMCTPGKTQLKLLATSYQ